LTRTPALTPCPVPTMMDIGVAKPRAHGQAMISKTLNFDVKVTDIKAAETR
jgi:hypothetical protein